MKSLLYWITIFVIVVQLCFCKKTSTKSSRKVEVEPSIQRTNDIFTSETIRYSRLLHVFNDLSLEKDRCASDIPVENVVIASLSSSMDTILLLQSVMVTYACICVAVESLMPTGLRIKLRFQCMVVAALVKLLDIWNRLNVNERVLEEDKNSAPLVHKGLAEIARSRDSRILAFTLIAMLGGCDWGCLFPFLLTETPFILRVLLLSYISLLPHENANRILRSAAMKYIFPESLVQASTLNIDNVDQLDKSILDTVCNYVALGLESIFLIRTSLIFIQDVKESRTPGVLSLFSRLVCVYLIVKYLYVNLFHLIGGAQPITLFNNIMNKLGKRPNIL